MNNKYLLFCDSEGTIAKNKKFNKNLLEALLCLSRLECKLVLTTGLPYHLISNMYDMYGIFDYYSLSNGSYIIDAKTKKEIFYKPIDSEALKGIKSLLKKYDLYYYFTSKKEEYTSCPLETNPSYTHIDSIDAVEECCQIKIQAKTNDEESLKAMKEIKDGILNEYHSFVALGNESINFSKPFVEKEPLWFSIVPFGVSKGSAFKTIMEVSKIKKENTIALGDSENDRTLLDEASLRILVRNRTKVKRDDALKVRYRNVPYFLYLLGAYIYAKIDIRKISKTLEERFIPLIADIRDRGKINPSELDVRYASRGIVRFQNKTAIFYKEKINEYKLPGGGIKRSETPEEAFLREIREEAGSKINTPRLIGICKESKMKTNFIQISFVYVSEVESFYEELSLTKEEERNESKIIFMDDEKAIDSINESINSLRISNKKSYYIDSFIPRRDLSILKYHLENHEE